MLYYNLLLRTWEKFLPNSNADLSIEYFNADPQFMFRKFERVEATGIHAFHTHITGIFFITYHNTYILT